MNLKRSVFLVWIAIGLILSTLNHNVFLATLMLYVVVSVTSALALVCLHCIWDFLGETE